MVRTNFRKLRATTVGRSMTPDAVKIHVGRAAWVGVSTTQQFWAFFPTQTSSLVAGILNAPWKTNEDRQSLLPGVYNDELLGAAAKLVADSLPKLSNSDAPARHLDALPRRPESGDNHHASELRTRLFQRLRHAAVFPDQRGVLCRLSDLRLPPGELTPGQRVETEILAR